MPISFGRPRKRGFLSTGEVEDNQLLSAEIAAVAETAAVGGQV
jgi:hypothetical protein